MYKKIIVLFIVSIFLLIKTSQVLALNIHEECKIDNDLCDKAQNLYCQPNPPVGGIPPSKAYICSEALGIVEECYPDHDACDKRKGLSCQPNPNTGASKKNVCSPPKGITDECSPANDLCDRSQHLSCQPNPPVGGIPPSKANTCQEDNVGTIFGKIKAPDALKGLIAQDPTGAGGLSIFFSNLITLFYIIATIVLIFMIVWASFDWITSEGDKEKVGAARNKIINAIIGIMLFAAAFGIIRILGQFTGFQFFVGQ